MSQGTDSIPLADRQAMANATAAARAAEQARIARLHAEAANDYRTAATARTQHNAATR